MSGAMPSISFDEIIQADREKRRNEQLAAEIFGRNSRPAISTRGSDRRGSRTSSLASRVGVAKRSNSGTNVRSTRSPTNHPFHPPSRPSSAAAQNMRTNRIATAMNSDVHANALSTSGSRLPGAGLSIRGTAGPFVVEATNFAPGTTAADIESALQNVAMDSNGASGMSSCRILSTTPTVIAEMVFAEKHIADSVIGTFNNQKADGRILHVYLKRSGPGSAPEAAKRRFERSLITAAKPPVEQEADLFPSHPHSKYEAPEADVEDVDMTNDNNVGPAPYDSAREAANQDRRERETKRADPDVQDRSYGFSDSTKAVVQSSHSQSQSRDEKSIKVNNGGRRDDERDRERDRDGDRDRDRDRDRRYDEPSSSRYDRHDDRGSYHRTDRGYDSGRGGGGRSSHYGNGVGGVGGVGGRGYGHPSGSGGMYSDGMMGRGRGGFRGRYRGY